MNLPFFWRKRQLAVSPGDRLGKLRKVLSKANISYPSGDPEAALDLIPPREPPARGLSAAVANAIEQSQSQPLEFPFAATERIAVLLPGFHLPKTARRFEPLDIADMRTYAPQGLVASLETALCLASPENIVSLSHALVATTSLDHPSISESARETLWRAFGVPVFEYLQAWDGTVIARECQVHDGLHVANQVAIAHLYEGEFVLTQMNRLCPSLLRVRTGLTADLVTEHCECGLETPRLRGVASLRHRSVAA